MPAYESAAPISAEIDVNSSGHVEVVASDRSDTTVEVTPTQPGRSGDIALARQATVTFEDNRLRVRVPGRLKMLGPGRDSVDVRLRGRDPELVVSRPAAADFAEAAPVTGLGAAAALTADATDDTATSRTTLRLPDQLKARVDKAAAEDGLSVNAWLVRAIAAGLEPKSRRSARREARSGDSFTGWVS